MGRGQWRSEDRLLVQTARQAGPWLVAVCIATLLLAGVQILVPSVLGRALDAVLGHGSHKWLFWAVGLVVVAALGDALNELADGASDARSTAWLRRSLLRRTLGLGTRRSLRFPAGELASRLTGNADQAGQLAPDVVSFCAGLITAVGALVALALIDFRLCLTFLAGIPLLLVALRRFAARASSIVSRYLAVQGVIAARLVDALSGVRTIAAAGTVAQEEERILRPLTLLNELGMQTWDEQTRIQAQEALILPLLQIAVLAVAGVRLAQGAITVGEMFAAAQYVSLASGVLSGAAVAGRISRARAAARRELEILDEPVVDYGGTALPEGGGRLEFRGVTVEMDGRRVIDDLELSLPAGSLVAVVGPTGSGKSTLAALAARLIDPDAGEVLLDGVPLPQLAKAELRRAVAYGFERPALVGDTLADVIGFGEQRPADTAIMAGAVAAQADPFIRRMPRGYDTPLAEAPMSGGEAQRMGLARAFAHAGRVLVLDDVTSSLDVATESSVARALTSQLADRTRLVVAHRASTAARADWVVWLEEGRVRRTAPHRVLWREPAYRALFSAGPSSPGEDV